MLETTMLLALPTHSTPQKQEKQDLNFALDWSNPCGGTWLGDNRTEFNKKFRVNKALRIVKTSALRERRTLAASTSVINISDIRNWGLFKKYYSFLPTLKPNSNIALRSWHRYLQVYAAAFGYLHRASMHWDQKQFMYESEVSKVLEKFKLSAHKVLCEIESAFNTTKTRGITEKPQRIHHQPITIIKPDVMLQRLQLRTHFKGLFNTPRTNLTGLNAVAEHVDTIDLKFAKQYYFNFLRNIVNIIKNHKRLKNKRKTQAEQKRHKKRIRKMQSEKFHVV